jgi:hypothetical protein
VQPTRWLQLTYLFSLVEMHFAVLCACTPTLKPFVQRYFGYLNSSTRGGSAPEEQAIGTSQLTKRMSLLAKASPIGTYRSSITVQEIANLDDDVGIAFSRRPSCVQESDLPWCGRTTMMLTDCEGVVSQETGNMIVPQDCSSDIANMRGGEVEETTQVQIPYQGDGP